MMAKIFSLEEVQKLLPAVKGLTEQAVKRAEVLKEELGLALSDEERASIVAEMIRVVEEWAQQIRELGCEPKGPWLVDFDSGHGYFCWQYGEEEVAHFHSYEAGFAGRMKLQ